MALLDAILSIWLGRAHDRSGNVLVGDRQGASRRRSLVFCGLIAVLVAIVSPGAWAAECPDGPAVARLVSMVGEVRVNGQPPRGDLPDIALCSGDEVGVGTAARATIYLLAADTSLRLDQETTAQFHAPPAPDSGLLSLARGAIYFLSEVRRSLTVRTPYVNAGVEGTEVYLRVADAGTELIVLEGQVAATPGSASGVPFATTPVVTGQRLEAAAGAVPAVTALPDDGTPFGALRRVTVGALSWTLYYPDVLVGAEAAADPQIAEAARLLVAGQREQAEAALAQVPDAGVAGGLAAALRTSIAVARGDAAGAEAASARAVELAPAAAAPRLARSYARQLALDLEGAAAAAGEAAALAPQEALPQARLAELYLMQGDVRRARNAADAAAKLGPSALTDMVQGFADLAAFRVPSGEAAFRRALQADSQNPLALLGLGLARINLRSVAEGQQLLSTAVAQDPSSALLRSYLGRANFVLRDRDAAAKQLAIAKELDPKDPTPFLFSAIQKLLDNRPVNALGDLEQSIALNDQRASYRSPLLLGQDFATRNTSLGQIYDNLGFPQLGLLAASRALAVAPANPNAHRLLADTVATLPRYDTLRASELFKAQLLERPSSAPIMPRLAYSDLNVLSAANGYLPGFNEYSALFQQQGASAIVTGLAGTQSTYGGEASAAAQHGPFSISVGTLQATTDGFRRNGDIDNSLYNVIAKAAITPEFQLYGELRRREYEQGDIALDFDLDSFDGDQRRDFKQTTGVLGLVYRPTPATTLLATASASKFRDKFNDDDVLPSPPFPTTDLRGHFTDQGYQLETQLIHNAGRFDVLAGGAFYDVDVRQRTRSLSEDDFGERFGSGYVYGYARPFQGTDLVLGLAVEQFSSDGDSYTKVSPKVGITQELPYGLTLRAARGRNIRRALLVETTLEPTEIAGFLQVYDDFNGQVSDRYSLGLDWRATDDLRFGIEGSTREIESVGTTPNGGDENLDESNVGAYGYWILSDDVTLSFQPQFDRFSSDDTGTYPNRVDTWLAPLEMRYFAPSGVFAFARGTYLYQDLDRGAESAPDRFEHGTSFLVDAGIGYRFPFGRGAAVLAVTNLLDEDLQYRDDNYRTSQDRATRFAPERMILATVNLQF